MSIENYNVAVYNYSESDTEEAAVAPLRLVKRRTFTWLYKQTFENLIDAKQWIDEQCIWSSYYDHDTEVGRRVQYR